MKKRFCDLCEKEEDFDKGFQLEIWDNDLEAAVFTKDVCKKCSKKIQDLVNDLVAKK